MALDVRSRLRGVGRAIRTGWLVLGVALGLGAVVEGSARLLVRGLTPGGADARAGADTYGGASWTADYFAEFNRTQRVRWEPYVYWRRSACRGTHVNVDEAGLRATWTPAGEAAASSRRVFAFGGSTMWGTGSRDEATIPSVLSRLLASDGERSPCRVTNFGETGWVSGQEVIALEVELRRGSVPDVVVFYDGINDTVSGPINGRAGIPQNELNRATEFNLLVEGPRMRRAAGRQIAQGLGVYRLYKRLAGEDPPPAIAEDPALALEVARAYRANVAHVNRLATAYGFKALFYWQPSIFAKKPLTRYEESVLAREARWGRFFESVRARVRELCAAEPGFHDVSDLFASDPEPRFIDAWHLGETGTELVARRIFEDLRAAVPR